MNFNEIALQRQSCRSYDPRPVEEEKLRAVLEAARLAPSACNNQPYHFTVCRGETAKAVATTVRGSTGANGFAAEAPVLIVVSEEPYGPTAERGSNLTGTDYRSIDMGLAVAYLTAEATTLGLGTCIIGLVDNERLMKICSLSRPARMVITLGYPGEKDSLRQKVRKDLDSLVSYM